MGAALRVIGHGGIDSLTHRAVAAEAGVSLGAVTHHFSKREKLAEAALNHAVERELERLKAFALKLQDTAFVLEDWAAAVARRYADDLRDDAATHLACYETFLAAARDPRYREIVDHWFDIWARSVRLALKAAGSRSAERHAEIVLDSLIGAVFRQLATPHPDFEDRMRLSILALANGLIAEDIG